jgi:hypothetical protein
MRGARPHATFRSALGACALAALALAAAGCAKKGPPSGGPPDLEPPRVVSAVPDSGSAHVPRRATLSVTFSEGMEPRSTGDAVALAPRVDVRQRRWSGRTMTLVLADTLAHDQTYTLFVGGGARDRHGNAMRSGATVVFTTADSFPPGRLEGEIQARGFTSTGTYLWCYDADRGRSPDSTARDFDAVGLADKDGRFRVTGLRVPGRWRLWAFADLNANRSFEPATDLLVAVDTVLVLTPEAPVASGLTVVVVNPRAPAHLSGRVTIEGRPDSTMSVRVWAVAEGDSTKPLSIEVRGDDSWSAPVTGGVWRLRPFLDRNHDARWQPNVDLSGEVVRVEVPPAGDVKNVALKLVVPPATRAEGP